MRKWESLDRTPDPTLDPAFRSFFKVVELKMPSVSEMVVVHMNGKADGSTGSEGGEIP